MHLFAAMLLSLIAVVGTTALHFSGVQRLDRLARSAKHAYPALLVVICGLIAFHAMEIATYATIFWLSDGPLGLGDFVGRSPRSALDYFYYSAEAYASLGYGDVTPTGQMRLIASIATRFGGCDASAVVLR